MEAISEKSQRLLRNDPTLPASQTFYYQQDHESSVTHLTDANGYVIEKYRYDVFGMPTILDPDGVTVRTASIVSNRFLFTGREYSAMFGFYEYRARAYHPGLGRFMSEDPKLFVRHAGLAASSADWSFGAHPDEAEFNLFRYCENDPIDFTDPMGLDAHFELVRDSYTKGANPRLSPGIIFVYENGHYLGAARANENGFYPNRQGIPAGNYLVLPKAEDGAYKKGTPAITAPKFKDQPGRATEGHAQGDILIHEKGTKSGEPDSRGCQTVSREANEAIKVVFDRNRSSTTETVRNGPRVPDGIEVRRALPAAEIRPPNQTR